MDNKTSISYIWSYVEYWLSTHKIHSNYLQIEQGTVTAAETVYPT